MIYDTRTKVVENYASYNENENQYGGESGNRETSGGLVSEKSEFKWKWRCAKFLT